MVERDDGFRRLDEPSAPEVRGRARRSNERLEGRGLDELAPRRVGAILDAALDALRARFLACFGACVALWIVPAWLLSYAPAHVIAPRWTNDPDLLPLALILASLLHSGLQVLIQIAGTILVGTIVHGEFTGTPVALPDALARVVRRFLPLVGTTILVAICAVLGFIACIVPYFLVLWRLSLAPLATAIDEVGPVQSLRRSFGLTRHTFLRWAAVIVVATVIVLPFSGFASAAADSDLRADALAQTAISPALYDALLWAAATLFFAIATAVVSAVTTSFYFDCRVRGEGLDLEQRLAAIRGDLAVGRGA